MNPRMSLLSTNWCAHFASRATAKPDVYIIKCDGPHHGRPSFNLQRVCWLNTARLCSSREEVRFSMLCVHSKRGFVSVCGARLRVTVAAVLGAVLRSLLTINLWIWDEI